MLLTVDERTLEEDVENGVFAFVDLSVEGSGTVEEGSRVGVLPDVETIRLEDVEDSDSEVIVESLVGEAE